MARLSIAVDNIETAEDLANYVGLLTLFGMDTAEDSVAITMTGQIGVSDDLAEAAQRLTDHIPETDKEA